MIIPDEFWKVLDTDDNDGVLNQNEFHRAVHAFDTGIIYGTPFLVYPIIETKYLKDFRVVYKSEQDVGKAFFAIVPVPNGTLAYSQASWQEWYNEMSEKSGLTFDSVDCGEKSLKSSLVSLQVDKLPETAKYALPLATLAKNSRIQLKRHVHLSDRVFFFRCSSWNRKGNVYKQRRNTRHRATPGRHTCL